MARQPPKVHLQEHGMAKCTVSVTAAAAVPEALFEKLPPEEQCKRCLSYLTTEKLKRAQQPKPIPPPARLVRRFTP